MGRIGASAVQPMTALGDLAYGGFGSVTGYINRMTIALGVSATISGGYAITSAAWDENEATASTWGDSGTGLANNIIRCDLANPRRIGRFRLLQSIGGAGLTRYAQFHVDSSTDNVNWTVRYTTPGDIGLDSGHVPLPAAITARYWRLVPTVFAGSGASAFNTHSLELDEVTTVGAGNPTRLAPPPERRVLGFDPDSGVPEWEARYAAIADVAGATPAGGVGTAAGGYDTAANRDTFIATVAEIKARLNNALAALRDRGLLT